MNALEVIEQVIKSEFGNTLIWDERSNDLTGKYFYIDYEGKQIGIFLGYTNSSTPYYTTFLFLHPVLCISPSEARNAERLFHKFMIKANLKLKSSKYRLIRGSFPALVRNMNVGDNIEEFFRESLAALKNTKPVYQT